MKKMHLPSRLLSMLLVLALLCGFAAPVGAAGSSSTGLSLTQVDNSAVSASLQEQAVEEPEEADYADTDMVRVSIVMETASTVGAGFATEDIAHNNAAMSYRAGLVKEQSGVQAKIEKATGEKLDVVWNLTLVGNIISANVPYGKLEAKYMIVSLPANPVGSVGTPEVYEEIIAFAREHDLLIVHDNAYSDIVFDGEPGGSFLQYPGALEVGVEFFSLSKSFNVTGARIGFLVGREDVVSAFAKLRSQIDFGMFFPIQKAAIACLNGPRDEVEAQRLKYQERRDALCDGLEGLGWERPNAHGSMFVWAKLPGGRTDSMVFCEELMEKAGVVVTPGASFGPSGEGHVRMALVLPPDQIALAVEAIREAGLY